MCKLYSFYIAMASCAVAAAGLTACGGETAAAPQIRPVKVTSVSAVDYIDRDFAGMATADDATNLAFKIAGQVSSVDVSKGDYVAKGALLAQLDPRDAELQTAADKAQYDKASSQLARMKRLLEHEAVSHQDYETAQTSFVQARSAYENSKDLLSETKLRAPFAGVIERTYVDTYERVQSGQTVVRLVNPVSSTVGFTIPEKSLPLLADSATRFYVTFDNYPDRRFAARLDTYAKTASDAYGFPVSLKLDMDAALEAGISPGMTCQVTMRTADEAVRGMAVPLSAVYAPADGGTYVWLVNSDDRVERRSVVLGDIFGRDMVSVQSGLADGEIVVTAGVYQLRDGERVRILNR